MLFYLKSTDPLNYNTIKFSTNLFAGSTNLEFRIKQLTTISTFLITTEEDYIIIEVNGEQYTIYFHERYRYNRDELASELTNLFTSGQDPSGSPEEFHFITVIDNDSGTLTFNCDNDFKIIDISHRAALLTGLYHTKLPTILTKSLKVKSVPYVCYGNNLYLRSNVSSIVGCNDSDNKDIYLSQCYHVFEILYPNMPVICRIPGNTVKIKSTDFTNLEFTLVDFQNEPVLLKAPLNIVMEVMDATS